MVQSIPRIFDDAKDAQHVAERLLSGGFDRSHVDVSTQDAAGSTVVDDAIDNNGGFFESSSSSDEEVTTHSPTGFRSTVLTVHTQSN